MSGLGPDCVKTSFNSVVGVNLPNFQKLQPAKLLISLTPKFQRMGRNHILGDSSTFSHSLGHKRTFNGSSRMSGFGGKADSDGRPSECLLLAEAVEELIGGLKS